MKKKARESAAAEVEARLQARSAELNRLIRTAALTLDEKGSLAVLAQKAGVGAEALRKSIRRGYFTAGLASSIELAVGRDVIQREQLCPHKFTK